MQVTSDRKMNKSGMLSNAFKGAVAGAIGVWVMDRLDWFVFRHENPQARHRTEAVRPDGMDPAHVAVNKLAQSMGTTLHPSQPHPAGIALHYALGIGPGMIYGALRERLPVNNQSQDFLYGLGLGLGLFLVQDEGLNRVMGLSAKPKDYPWQAHARGLAAHLTLGLVANAVLNVLKAARPVPRPTSQIHQPIRTEPGDAMPMVPVRNPGTQRAALH